MENQHTGRIEQTLIYTGKLFRMFIFQNDWKMLAMASIIGALISFVISDTLFVSMKGTLTGAFALVCICIWNGCFNSIQAICRERPIIKREHRSGLHMSSYVAAHMIYQAFICICQTVLLLIILNISGAYIPAKSFVTGNVILDLGITLFLSTYAADMIALFISAIVRNTTTAMTIMPFIMIIQLVFSGGFFTLKGFANEFTKLSLSNFGLTAVCAIGDYNSLPNDIILEAIDNIDIYTPSNKDTDEYFAEVAPEFSSVIKELSEDEEMRSDFADVCGVMSYNMRYRSTDGNIISCWLNIAFQVVFFSAATVIVLEFIDKDKR